MKRQAGVQAFLLASAYVPHHSQLHSRLGLFHQPLFVCLTRPHILWLYTHTHRPDVFWTQPNSCFVTAVFDIKEALWHYIATDGKEPGRLPCGIPMDSETLGIYYDILSDSDAYFVRCALAHRMIQCQSVDIQWLLEPSQQHTHARCRDVLAEVNKQWRRQSFSLRMDITRQTVDTGFVLPVTIAFFLYIFNGMVCTRRMVLSEPLLMSLCVTVQNTHSCLFMSTPTPTKLQMPVPGLRSSAWGRQKTCSLRPWSGT